MTFTNYETGFAYEDFFRLDPDDAQAEGYQWARTLADIENELDCVAAARRAGYDSLDEFLDSEGDPLPPIGEVELF
jgi:hypothetical protein